MNYTFQLKSRNRLSLLSGRYFLTKEAQYQVKPNSTMSANGLMTMAHIQPSMG